MMKYSLGEELLSLFADFYKLSLPEKKTIRAKVLMHLTEQNVKLESYFTGLIERKEYDELELVMPLFWMETDKKVCLSIAHQIMLSAWIEPNEDFIHFIQRQRQPDSVHYIRRSIEIRSSLPPYVGLSMYYNQCGYALRDIGTPEALSLIKECTRSKDPTLSAGMKSFIAANMDGPAFEHPDELWW